MRKILLLSAVLACSAIATYANSNNHFSINNKIVLEGMSNSFHETEKDLSVILSSNKCDTAKVLLLDEAGNVVYEKNESIVRGKNNLHIKTQNLPNGWYLLKVKNGSGELVLTRKIAEI
jgi:hypothetical protein